MAGKYITTFTSPHHYPDSEETSPQLNVFLTVHHELTIH